MAEKSLMGRLMAWRKQRKVQVGLNSESPEALVKAAANLEHGGDMQDVMFKAIETGNAKAIAAFVEAVPTHKFNFQQGDWDRMSDVVAENGNRVEIATMAAAIAANKDEDNFKKLKQAMGQKYGMEGLQQLSYAEVFEGKDIAIRHAQKLEQVQQKRQQQQHGQNQGMGM